MSEAENLDLLERAMELEPDKRLSLATKLLDSVEEPEKADWSDAWAAEIDRRIQSLRDGTAQPVSWESVRDEALARLRKR